MTEHEVGQEQNSSNDCKDFCQKRGFALALFKDDDINMTDAIQKHGDRWQNKAIYIDEAVMIVFKRVWVCSFDDKVDNEDNDNSEEHKAA